jgi:hypothetical protein
MFPNVDAEDRGGALHHCCLALSSASVTPMPRFQSPPRQ